MKTLKVFRNKLLPITEKIRIRRDITAFLGPEYPPSHDKIEIDITYDCNLRCRLCNRFLDFAPSKEEMSPEQIKKFINESIKLGRKWEAIFLSGGEPALHPRISEIIGLLTEYKNNFSPATKLYLLTNGFHNSALVRLPPIVAIIDSEKDTCLPAHVPVTRAPIDLATYKNADFSNGCSIAFRCAMGLNMHGYYQCTVAAAIDRIFGFDAGRKNLPEREDDMIDLYRKFCRYCGHFLRAPISPIETLSFTWQRAIDNYTRVKPSLSVY